MRLWTVTTSLAGGELVRNDRGGVQDLVLGIKRTEQGISPSAQHLQMLEGLQSVVGGTESRPRGLPASGEALELRQCLVPGAGRNWEDSLVP